MQSPRLYYCFRRRAHSLADARISFVPRELQDLNYLNPVTAARSESPPPTARSKQSSSSSSSSRDIAPVARMGAAPGDTLQERVSGSLRFGGLEELQFHSVRMPQFRKGLIRPHQEGRILNACFWLQAATSQGKTFTLWLEPDALA